MYKVLLVDDEYMITEGLKRLIPFEKWDMEVVATANHADEALDYVREHPVDIVISDVNMPDKTGLEMIQEMKNILPDSYYILLSGYQEFDYVKKAMNLSVVDYLVKPVDKVELGNILEKNANQLGEKIEEPLILSQKLDEEALLAHLSHKENWWIGLSKISRVISLFHIMCSDRIGKLYLQIESLRDCLLYLLRNRIKRTLKNGSWM